MSTRNFKIEAPDLDSEYFPPSSSPLFKKEGKEEESKNKGESNTIPLEEDPRLKLLSYSSLLTLHSCPRKFQLQKLNSTLSPESKSNDPESPFYTEQELTFSFGHMVGEAVQLLLVNKSLSIEETLHSLLWKFFINYKIDLLYEDTKRKKSFFHAVKAITLFANMLKEGFLSEYEVLQIPKSPENPEEQIPATEFGFKISFPKNYFYRGAIDCILRNSVTGEILILEIKTSSLALNSALYKNSAQALGYSLILDSLFPTLSSYAVKYLVFNTKEGEYNQLDFTKSLLQRALWLQDILLDIEFLESCKRNNHYPMRGESCFSFFRECPYLGVCTLSVEHLVSPLSPDDLLALTEKESDENYLFNISFEEVVRKQLEQDY